MRTFLAVEASENARRAIHDFTQQESKKGLPIKWVGFDKLHITLKFLGEIDEKKRTEISPVIETICRKNAPFVVEMAGVGCFPDPRNPRVLWVGVKQGGKELCAIATELEKELAPFGFKEEKRFHPHLTIGRVKKRCSVEDILTRTISAEPYEVSSLVLFRSTLRPDGPIYDELSRFKLG
jgi:2'-5' RNA ligase